MKEDRRGLRHSAPIIIIITITVIALLLDLYVYFLSNDLQAFCSCSDTSVLSVTMI